VKNKTAIYGTLFACVALQAGVASAQGIPVVGGPSYLDDIRSQVSAIQTQFDAVRASHDTTSSNALLVQILTAQKANLAELESIDQHMQRTEADQHLAAQTLQQQFILQVAHLVPSQTSSQSRLQVDPSTGGSQGDTALTTDQGQHHADAR
jgi:hypothetical protein